MAGWGWVGGGKLRKTLCEKERLGLPDAIANHLKLPLSKPYLTFFQTTNFGLLQTGEFADDNFKFYENGQNFYQWVENTVG